QYQNRRVADFWDRAQQHGPFSQIIVSRLLVNLVFNEVPNPFYFDVSGVRAQPGVRAFFSGGFRFTALSPPGFPIAPAEQAGSRINVKPVDRRNLAVSQSV